MHGSPKSKKLLIAGLVALACLLAAGPAVGPARAQGQALLDVAQPGGLMRMQIGAPQLVQVGTNYWIRPAGRFQLLTGPTAPMGGDPTRNGDENTAVVSRAYVDTNGFTGFTSTLQFSVDNTVTGATGVTFDTYAAMNAVGTNANPGALPNYWPVPLMTTTRGVTGTSLVPLTNAGPSGVSLTVYHNYQLVGDALMLELVITNSTPATHKVGVRWVLDTGFGGSTPRDGTSLSLPDGTVIDTEQTLPGASTAALPSSWVSFDDPSNPLISVKGVLDAPEVHLPGIAGSVAGVPDALEVGLWGRLVASGFNFIPNPALSITGEDWGVAVKWSELDLAPNASRRYVTYIAFGASVANYDSPFATMSYGPRRLQPVAGDDPATSDLTETYYYTDGQGRSPFPMSVFVDNFGSSALFGTTASINLPEGLTLLPDTQARTQSLGVIPRDTLLGAIWTVNAATARPGVVSVGMNGPRGRAVNRSLTIPAVPVLNPRVSARGLEMISIPYEFTNNDAEHVFESLGGLQPGQSGSLIRWDPTTLTYRWFPDPFVTNVTLGHGYWLLNRTAAQIVLPPDARPAPSTGPISLPLSRGWNQIGNPFTLTARLETAQVLSPSGAQISMREAISQGLLQPTLFSYNPATGQYEWEEALSQVRMDPYVGYWLLVRYDGVALVIPPPTAVGVAAASASRVTTPPSGWRARVLLTGAGSGPAVCSFGVARNAREETDAQDVVAPPVPFGAGLQAAFVATEAGGEQRLVDLKRDDGRQKTWLLQVTSAGPQRELALSWPDLSAIPDQQTLVLEDTANGTRCYMRTTATYRFQMAEAGTRLFKITVEPRGSGAALLTAAQAQAAPGGNYALTYTLAAPASVDVLVRNIAGVAIRRVRTGQVSAAGQATVLWNARNDRGSRVPPGRYLCEITARSAETGQAGSMVVTFEVTR